MQVHRHTHTLHVYLLHRIICDACSFFWHVRNRSNIKNLRRCLWLLMAKCCLDALHLLCQHLHANILAQLAVRLCVYIYIYIYIYIYMMYIHVLTWSQQTSTHGRTLTSSTGEILMILSTFVVLSMSSFWMYVYMYVHIYASWSCLWAVCFMYVSIYPWWPIRWGFPTDSSSMSCDASSCFSLAEMCSRSTNLDVTPMSHRYPTTWIRTTKI